MASPAVSPLMSDTCRECGADSGTIGVIEPDVGSRRLCMACVRRERFETAVSSLPQTAAYVADPVNHPPHYKKHPSGVECITVTEHFNFNRGNAIKYIWRAGEKGNELEDLRKAAWYLQREIARLEKP